MYIQINFHLINYILLYFYNFINNKWYRFHLEILFWCLTH
jgi:hypothetical protein